MALKEIPVVKFEYELTEPGFKGTRFTKSSDKELNLADAVKFAAGQNAVLQSLGEAAVFHMHAPIKYNGSSYPPAEDNADRSQLTRTVGIGFAERNKRYVAYDDVSDSGKNLILARAQEGLKASTSRWELPKDDKHVAQILERAEKERRIIKVDQHSRFSYAKAIRAALGPIAKAYNNWFDKNQGYGIEFGLLSTPCDEKSVIVQPLFFRYGGRINAETDSGITYHTIDSFHIKGHARGVRLPAQNTSETQGDLENAVTALKEGAAFRMNGTMYVPVKREIIEKAK